MWDLRKSRNMFMNHFPAKRHPESVLLSLIFGEKSHGKGQGNYVLLDQFMTALTRESGAKSSKNLYCGLVSENGFERLGMANALAASYNHKNGGAWVGVDNRFIEMTAAVSDLGLMFLELIQASTQQEGGDVQRMLDGGRGSFFRHVGQYYPERVKQYADDSDLFLSARQRPKWLNGPRSSIFFTIAHEIDHLFRPTKRRNQKDDPAIEARLKKIMNAYGSLWPSPDKKAHEDELIADFEAVVLAGESAHRTALSLSEVMVGSFYAIATVALDGWFLDESKPSETHPSAFLRAEGLLLIWRDFLNNEKESGFINSRIPTESELLDVAVSYVFVRWIGGRYSAHRRGANSAPFDVMSVKEDLCSAAGLAQVIHEDLLH